MAIRAIKSLSVNNILMRQRRFKMQSTKQDAWLCRSQQAACATGMRLNRPVPPGCGQKRRLPHCSACQGNGHWLHLAPCIHLFLASNAWAYYLRTSSKLMCCISNRHRKIKATPLFITVRTRLWQTSGSFTTASGNWALSSPPPPGISRTAATPSACVHTAFVKRHMTQ